MARMQTDFNQLVGAIYDCAVEPALWPNVLSEIRDRFSAAYAEMGIINHLPNPTLKKIRTVRRATAGGINLGST